MNAAAPRIVLGLLAVATYGLGALLSREETELTKDIGPGLAVVSALSMVLIVASIWPRRRDALLVAAAALVAVATAGAIVSIATVG